MSDVEGDFSDYESTRDLEGGLHNGRSNAPRGLTFVAVTAAALVFIG